ncbi:dormancy-associated protein homolog 4 isoform X1 [Actinidia eriantha]|uniref:dormancy-associated protein homolog 4 isoform X1 n=1 Tax=Actinidia eriantha TaxID=165200 RepID=UPI00258B7352|nr:dormancy-associated protein homolog 4 isoform X1 [Actinidia eriantha]
MGFLHKLWDETLAGPTPDSGLGKLRKYDSFSGVRSPPPTVIIPPDDQIPVSRSITIIRANSVNLSAFRNDSADSGSLPASPAGSSTPTSPFSPSTPRGDLKRFTRRKSRPEPLESTDPISPTVYDWFSLCFSVLK